MKFNLKSFVMLAMASAMCLSFSSCDKDDDDDKNVIFENEIGKIVEVGNSIYATEKRDYVVVGEDEKEIKITDFTTIITFEKGLCVKGIERITFTSNEDAKLYYDEMLAYEFYDEDPVLNGKVVSGEITSEIKGESKDKLIAGFISYLKGEDNEDEE